MVAPCNRPGTKKRPAVFSPQPTRLPPPRLQTATLLTTTSLIFTPLAAVCWLASSSVTEVALRYDDLCAPGATAADRATALAAAGGAGLWCSLPLPPSPRDMQAPVYVHYALTKFYQNHRRYVRSRSDAQLRGTVGGDTSVCAPRAHAANATLPPPVPCGLVAWSAFNDTLRVLVEGAAVRLTQLAPGVSRRAAGGAAAAARARFAPVPSAGVNVDPASRGGRQPSGMLSDDDALQAWMDPAALPSFRKRVGAIDGGLSSVDSSSSASLVLTNAFNSYAYGGTKTLVVTDVSWLGGRNPFLGWACAMVAAAAGAGALVTGAVAAKRSRGGGRVADEALAL